GPHLPTCPVTELEPEPCTFGDVLKSEYSSVWEDAIADEFNGLLSVGAFSLATPPIGSQLVLSGFSNGSQMSNNCYERNNELRGRSTCLGKKQRSRIRERNLRYQSRNRPHSDEDALSSSWHAPTMCPHFLRPVHWTSGH
ncbi:unnamed protein product, partial [Discosporangium mesarthrocarpum]